MSIKKTKEQQDKLWNEIYKMNKKKIGRKFNIKNKNIILDLTKVGNELGNIRDKIINVF